MVNNGQCLDLALGSGGMTRRGLLRRGAALGRGNHRSHELALVRQTDGFPFPNQRGESLRECFQGERAHGVSLVGSEERSLR